MRSKKNNFNKGLQTTVKKIDKKRALDFTEKGYKSLIETAKKGYKFISYKEAIENRKERYIILRHDIDFSPHRALAMARIEYYYGIRTTYCIGLGSAFYNIFEKKIKDILLKIKKLKHHFGLHFDPTLYAVKKYDSVIRHISQEREILAKTLMCSVETVSFHNPTNRELKLNTSKIAGLFNAYSDFSMNKTKYISDSNGYWRFERLKDVLLSKRYERLHILIHPAWWQKKPISPWKRIERCIDGRRNSTSEDYKILLRRAGRENAGYESDIIR